MYALQRRWTSVVIADVGTVYCGLSTTGSTLNGFGATTTAKLGQPWHEAIPYPVGTRMGLLVGLTKAL